MCEVDRVDYDLRLKEAQELAAINALKEINDELICHMEEAITQVMFTAQAMADITLDEQDIRALFEVAMKRVFRG